MVFNKLAFKTLASAHHDLSDPRAAGTKGLEEAALKVSVYNNMTLH